MTCYDVLVVPGAASSSSHGVTYGKCLLRKDL